MESLSVSIAMATYNGAPYIREQLDSLARQTHLPGEVVITDDQSTDATLEIARAFAETAPFPVRIHRNEKRLGFGGNFLAAAGLCGGDLIAFCDQDDVWLEHKLARCADCFEKDPDAMAVSHNAWVADKQLNRMQRLWPLKSDVVIERLRYTPMDFDMAGFTQVFRAQLLHLGGWKDRPVDLHGDQPIIHDRWIPLLASALGRIVRLAEPLVLYRQHGSNTCSAFVTRGTAEKARLIRSAGGDVYRRKADRLNEWAEALNRISGTSPAPRSQQFREAAQRYRNTADHYEDRGRLYDAGMPRSIGCLVALASHGGYGPRSAGGLGRQALLKDTLMSLLGKGK